jgi:LPPG:FO 2-phospho-L-lactate transferase
MDALRARGQDVWFNLGDRDLQICRSRKQHLDAGVRLTDNLLALRDTLGVSAAVLPMTDDPVQTTISSGDRTIGLQEFLIAERGAAPIDDVIYVGAGSARPTAEVLTAVAEADVIIMGPSNPILSIGPILAIEPLRAALQSAAAPVIAVSPIVDGQVLKGPTAACMRWAGHSVNASGIASHYGALLDGLVSDESIPDVPMPHLTIDTNLADQPARRSVAAAVLAFASSLR